MKNSYKLWITLSLIIVFAAGLIGGILLDRHILDEKPKKEFKKRRPEHFPTLDMMAQELNLTQEQQDQIKRIFEHNEKRLMTLRGQIHKQFDNMRSQLKMEIKEVLTEEQNTKFEAMIERYTSQWRDRSDKKTKSSGKYRKH